MRKQVIVIGAGIAGATTALFLLQAGLDVLVIEEKSSHDILSSSDYAICNMNPRFDAELNKYTLFYLAAYVYGLEFYKSYPDFFISTGMNIFPRIDAVDKLRRIEEILGDDICTIDYSAQFGQYLHLINSGYLYIKRLCKHLLKDMNVLYNNRVAHIKENMNGSWAVINANGHAMVADYLVLANSYNVINLIPSLKKHLRSIRGQSSSGRFDIGLSSRDVLCFPSISLLIDKDCNVHFGSTYDRDGLSCELDLLSHKKNIYNLSKYFHIPEYLGEDVLSGFAGVRSVSTDYLPIVGEVIGHKNLYLNIGHGSRGVASAPLSAKLLSGLITDGECDKLLEVLSPKRFLNGLAR